MTRIRYDPITPPVKAVFMDFGDTIVETMPLYVERLRISFGKLGVKKSFEEMERAYIEADWRSAASLIGREPFPQDAWRGLFAAVMVEKLGVRENTRALMLKLADEMTFIRPVRKLIEGASDFLDFCKSKRLILGLLSNNDGRTAAKCREVGIEKYFDIILDSTLEGIMKPNPEMFMRALEKTGVKASEALHIGDLLGCDVLGAQKAGIKAVWFHRRSHIPRTTGIHPDWTVHRFDEIEALLAESGG